MSIARVPVEAAPADVAVHHHGRGRRAVELVGVTLTLPVLVPLLALIALAVATTSRGPVLYRQRRVGRGGHEFEILKFRTMRVDADQQAALLFARRNDAAGPLHKLYDDPRVTRVGRLLRRLSLDELPQLWNVLTGTMALVGPRPALPHEVARFAPRDHGRHRVRPGMTGLAQVSGRSDLSWEEAIDLDLHYVAHRSFRLDLGILLRTLPAVLRGRGAY